MMWRVLAIAAACASALEVAPLAHLGEAAPPVRLGCATSVSIPKFYQRSFYINTTFKVGDERIFLYENISIVSDAVMLYGSNFLAMHPSTGVVSRECVLSFQIDANNHNLMAAAVGISANTSLCLRFLFKPTVYRDVFAMLFSFEFQSWDAHLLCDTAHRHPTHMIDSTQAITNTSVIFSCPSEAVIPQELIQDPVHSRCDLPSTREVGIPCYVGFMSTGWFVVSMCEACTQWEGVHRAPFHAPLAVCPAEPDRFRLLCPQRDLAVTCSGWPARRHSAMAGAQELEALSFNFYAR